jgi:hypothetical protein
MKREVKVALVVFIIIIGACIFHSVEHKTNLMGYWLLCTGVPSLIYGIGYGIRKDWFDGDSDGYPL